MREKSVLEVERAWQACRYELEWAKHHLRLLKEDAARIRRDRRTISTGRATQDHMDHARATLALLRQDLANIEAALRRLAEAVVATERIRSARSAPRDEERRDHAADVREVRTLD